MRRALASICFGGVLAGGAPARADTPAPPVAKADAPAKAGQAAKADAPAKAGPAAKADAPAKAGPAAKPAAKADAPAKAGQAAKADAPAKARPARPRWQELPLPPPMPPAASTGHVEAAGGAQIYYATFGKPGAPPVILLHGGLGNGDHFAFQVPALAERFHVIAIDSRGQGRSTLGKGKLTYQVMAADVVAVMDALKLPKASIAGWSDGGAIALALGIGHAGRVDKLFVFGTNYDSRGSKPRTVSSATFNAYAVKCRSDHRRVGGSPKAYEAAISALLPVWRDPGSFTKDQLRSIQAPTLVADGDHDEIIELAQIKEMSELIPHAKLKVLADTSHFALWQDPATFTKTLVDFLTAG